MIIQQATMNSEAALKPLLPFNYPTEHVIDHANLAGEQLGGQTAVCHPTIATNLVQERLMQRIIVVGSSGSGKSTLTRQLSQRLGLPKVHLDKHFWHPGWQGTPFAEWQAQVAEFAAGKCWIIDGNYRSTLDVRLQMADTVVFLDLPRWLCVLRAVKRRFQYMRTPRPDIATGCKERIFDPYFPLFLRRIWDYPNRAKPQLLQKMVELNEHKRIIHLTSRTAVNQFLHSPHDFPVGLQTQPPLLSLTQMAEWG